MKKPTAFLLLTCLITFVAQAQKDNIQTDRPGKSLNPNTVTKKAVQLEIGLSKEFDKIDGQKHEEYLYPTLMAKYGLTKKLELRLQIENEGDYDYTPQKHRTASGVEPIQLGIKFAMLEEKRWMPQVSIVATAALPKLASPDYRSDFVAPTFVLVMQNSLSKKLSLSYNLGIEYKPDNVHALYIYTLSPQYKVSDKVKVFGEAYGLLSAIDNPDHRFDAGVAYLLKSNMQLDLLGGFGLTRSSVNKFIEAGFSIRLPR